MDKLAVIILAAGKGTRMKSDLPKVLHLLAGRPMLLRVIDAVKALSIKPDVILVVIGHQAEKVRKVLGRRIKCVVQEDLLGTAHAVMIAKPGLKDFRGTVLVLCGDTPLIRPETLSHLIRQHRLEMASASILTSESENPGSYGRIIRGPEGRVEKIVEANRATEAERAVKEWNTGIYCFNSEDLFSALGRVKLDTGKGEYYLPDVIEIFLREERKVITVSGADPGDVIGIDTVEKLSEGERIFKRRCDAKENR